MSLESRIRVRVSTRLARSKYLPILISIIFAIIMATHRIAGILNPGPLRRKTHQSLQCIHIHRKASTYHGMAELSEDVDPSSSMQIPGPSEEHIKAFDPIARSRRRAKPLPPSR